MKFLSKKLLLILSLVIFLPIPADAFILEGFDLLGLIVSPFAYFLLTLTSLITMLSGVLLNGAIQFTIVDMSTNFEAIQGINQAWTVIRDVANMGFIFVLLYASIMTIIGKEENAREIVVNIIIAAVLINFSLFFTKVAIDVFNMLAIVFYKATVAVPPAGALDFTSTGLSNAIMGALGVTSIFGAAGTFENASSVSTIAILSSVVLLITSFVFLAMSLMLIIRFVALIFVLILSPIAFLSGVLPGLSGVSKQWKDTLVGQGVFAPIFFLMMYVTIVLTNSIRATTFGSSGGSLASIFGGGQTGLFEASGVPTLINFIIIIIFLVASLLISKKYSDMAPSGVSKVTKWATGLAGGATFGLAGRLGRNIVGSRAAEVANNDELRKKAAQGSIRSRLQLAAANKMAKSSFDVRGTSPGGELGAGKAKTGGFIQDQKDRAKKYEPYKPTDSAKKKAQSELETQDKALEAARQAARKEADKNVPKPETLVKAEQELQNIEKETYVPDQQVVYNPEEAAKFEEDKKNRIEEAKKKIDEENKKFQSEVNNYVKNQTTKEEGVYQEALRVVEEQGSRMENMAKEAERGTVGTTIPFINKKIGVDTSNIKIPDFVPMVGGAKLSGFILSGKDKAAAIRSAAKGKSAKDQAVEALKKLQESGDIPSEDKRPAEGGGDAGAEKTKPSSE